MKTKIHILFIVLLFSFISHAQPLNLVLNGAESGTKVHQARNSITFGAGYSYTPSGGTLSTVFSGPAISGTVSYASAINPASYSINTNLTVGKTPGILTAEGSANYSIPLDLPKGRNGVQPSISLNYANSYADGLMGIGWNIAGISSICRINETIYHDAKSDAIRGDLTDKYALDGNRLLVTNGSYGAASSEYRTEIEQFSKVVAYGTTGSGPEWFKVYAKSGLIYEFGNTEDSRVRNNDNCILAWKLNKVTDRYNNYMTFSYISSDDEHPIGEIEYTANSSMPLTPFAKILFYYKNRTDVSSYCYGGKIFNRDILLDNIEIQNNGQTYKKYVMTYMRDVFAQLIKVTEYSGQGTTLNPTVFAWTTETAQYTQADYATTLDQIVYAGDFNGDGRSDMVTTPRKTAYSSSDQWKLYLTNSSGNMVLTSQGYLNSSFKRFLVNDYNGDGLTDLMMQEGSVPATFYFYISSGSSFSRSASGYTCPDESKMDVVDYNGDGRLEFLYHSDFSHWYLYNYSGSLIINGSIAEFGVMIGSSESKNYRVTDFNGDGCSDILAIYPRINGQEYKVFEFKGTNDALIETYSGLNILSSDVLFFGDFNGDNRTEIIKVESSPSPNPVKLLTLACDGFQESVANYLDNYVATLESNNYDIRDVNGDGRMDFVSVGKGWDTANSSNRIIVVFGSDGNFSGYTEYTSAITFNGTDDCFNWGDFNGDGFSDFFYKSGSVSKLHKFFNSTPAHLVNTIIDGFGAKTTITYQPMTNSSVYTKGSGAVYPLVDYSSASPVVSQVARDNGIGGTAITSYKYSAAKLHMQGKGFLGFSKITVTDGATSIFKEDNYAFDETFYYPQLSTSYTKRGTTILSTTVNSWNEVNFGSKRILPYVNTSTTTDGLTGFVTTTTTAAPDSYGNITSQSVAYSNGPTYSKSIVYSNDVTNWLVARPCSITTTMSKAGESNVVQLVTTTYASGKGDPDLIKFFDGAVMKKQIDNDYNTNGTLSVVHDLSSGLSTKHTYLYYDANGVNLTGKTLPDGTTESYTYYSTSGLVNTATDYWGNVATYNYDYFGNVSSMTQTGGVGISSNSLAWVTSPTYARYKVTQTNSDGSVSENYYDLLGREIRRGSKLFSGTMSYVQTDYNSKGQAYRVSEPFTSSASLWNTTTFDDYGRTSGVTPSVGASASYSYSGGTTTVASNGRTYATEIGNAAGWVSAKSDPGGTIQYYYKPDGNVKQIKAPGSVNTYMTYDVMGNRLSLDDPSAGTSSATYYGGGELNTQTTPLGTTTYHYLTDGKLDYYTNTEGTYDYTYGTNKQVSSVAAPDGVSRSYTYYSNGKVHEISETIESGQTNKVTFVYDSYGRVSSKTYTNSNNVSQTESYVYNSYGYLDQIKFNGTVVYDVSTVNTRGQITAASINGTSASWSYNTYGQLTSSAGSGIQSYTYSPNTTTGNLNSRTNSLRSLTENFYYDSLDRLDSVTKSGVTTLDLDYDSKGNLTTKSDAGTLLYDNGNPYQVAHVTPYTSNFPSVGQTATYSTFGKVSTLLEGAYSATFKYNADNERIKMVVNQNGSPVKTKYYFGNSYEKVIEGSTTTEYIWLGGSPYTAVAVAKIVNGDTPLVLGIFRDNLGTITHVKNGSTVYEYSFDAYGRRRDKDNWSYTLSSEPVLIADRGYTGHEHLTEFGLINMNGRLYDPLVGRFLSADQYVQEPGFTQSYNRYGYCWNNPLRYTDPSGQQIPTVDLQDVDPERRNRSGFHLGGGGNVWDNIPHIAAWKANEYSYSDGRYYNGYGQEVSWQEAVYGSFNKYGGIMDIYAVYETAYKLSQNGPFIWNGNFGIIKTGTMVATGDYPTSLLNAANSGGNSLYAIGMGLNAAGFVSSAGEYSNVINGSWRGVNGKWNSLEWGGNKWTGARANALSKAGYFKLASRGFFVVGTGISLYQGGDALLNGNYAGAAKSGLDIGMGAFATFGGPPGWIIGGGYFALDALGAFDRPMITTSYTPPMYAVPDNTYVARPVIFPLR